MGVSAGKSVYARDRDGTRRLDDRGEAPRNLCQRAQRGPAGGLTAALLLLCISAAAASADTLRIASFNTELSRDGPGLFLRDILKAEDADIASALAAIDAVAPDIIALQGMDYDLSGAALKAFSDRLAHPYEHHFALPPNSGLQSGIDLNGDGRLGTPEDAQGYGAFHGQGGMALLSRIPLGDVVDHSARLWAEQHSGAPLPPDVLPAHARGVQRLSSTGHWQITVPLAQSALTLLVYHATPPVFDGPEDRNGLRNAAETQLWLELLEQDLTYPVVMGVANLDPDRGDGRGAVMRQMLTQSPLQDPLPGQATADFAQTGPLRVDYVLPDARLQVSDAGLHWPAGESASRHAIVWVDIALP